MLSLFSALFIFFILNISVTAADNKTSVKIEVHRDQSASAAANASTPIINAERNEAQASASSSGGESSQCKAYGRPSFSKSSSVTRIQTSEQNRLILNLESDSYANGGHYRTCPGGCILGNCVGNHGNDTTANSSSRTAATARISIENPPKKFSYEVHAVIAIEGGSVSLSVVTPDGKPVEAIDGRPGYYSITEKVPSLLVRTSASTAAQNNGGCCSQAEAARGTVTIDVDPAPQLDTIAKLEPFIVNGKPTTGYPYVVGIGYKGLLHCSGTFVGKRTIVTAAHCIYGYENQIQEGHFDVRFGNNFYLSEDKFKISNLAYPEGEGGIKFNPSTFEDDIAVLYLDREPSSIAAKFLASDPTWDNIVDSQLPINIVGFGFNMIDGGRVGLGVKREASIKINSVSNRTIYFENQNANTCNGDSGGSSFVEAVTGTALFFAAVTSGGDNDCTRGRNMRLDAFQGWLSPRIQ